MTAPLLSADLFLTEFIEIKICFFGNVLHLTKPVGGDELLSEERTRR